MKKRSRNGRKGNFDPAALNPCGVAIQCRKHFAESGLFFLSAAELQPDVVVVKENEAHNCAAAAGA